jgi:CheY-like chemotaxis protein
VSDHSVILLVEDRQDDVVLIRKAFQNAYLNNPLHVVADGEEAMAYLIGEGKYSNRAEHPLPELILLDLKMPKVDGFEVLEWLQNQPSLARIPVVVLTSSDHIKDVNKAYALGANSFLVKPLDFENYAELAKLIHRYWVKTSKAPETSRPPRSPRGKTNGLSPLFL